MPETDAHIVIVTRRYTIVSHVCPVCGTSFTGTKKKTYCSVPCKRRAEWQRYGEKINERRKKERREKHHKER